MGLGDAAMSMVAVGATFKEVEQHMPVRQVSNVAHRLLVKRQDLQDSLHPCEKEKARAAPNGTARAVRNVPASFAGQEARRRGFRWSRARRRLSRGASAGFSVSRLYGSNSPCSTIILPSRMHPSTRYFEMPRALPIST